MTFYIHFILEIDIIYTHLFYFPIILASFWWKKKGLVLSIFIVGFLIFLPVFYRPGVLNIDNLLRILIAISIGVFIVFLSEKISNVTDNLQKSEKKCREAYNRTEFYRDLLAHDINNILQSILSGMLLNEMYIENPKNLEELKSTMRIIKEQVWRGSKLVSNVHKLSQLEKTEILIEQIEVCKILKKSITYAKNAFQDRNVNIQVDSVGETLHIQANNLLEDVFENILINAVKYTENPTVEIIVKISKEQKENINYIKMEFIDNGIGVDDTRKKNIFLRGHNEDKYVRGMGLGLSLVKIIIKNYYGKIWVEDRVKGDHSKGCNFVLLIPEMN